MPCTVLRVSGLALAVALVVSRCTTPMDAPQAARAPIDPPQAAEKGCGRPASAASWETTKLFPEFKRSVEKSAFFAWSTKTFGTPTACHPAIARDSLDISYAFPKSAKLTASSTPSIEISIERLELPDASGVDSETLLRAQEKTRFGQDGYWEHPKRDSGPVTSFWSDVCNCQARIGPAAVACVRCN